MLLRFEVENHRSIRGPVELSMIAVDADRPAVRTFERLAEPVLTVAGIYGPNASGKSNVLDSLGWLSMAVASSLRGWDEFIPRDPFRFGDGPTASSTFEVEMMVDGVRHSYRLEVDDSTVLFEQLVSYPVGRGRVLFTREGMDITLRRGTAGITGLRELLTPTTLALSAARRLNLEEISPFARRLSALGSLNASRSSRRASLSMFGLGRRSTLDIFLGEENPEARADISPVGQEVGDRETALALLRFADLGIEDVRIVDRVIKTRDGHTLPRRDLHLVHRANGQDMSFDMMDESEGTRTWFRLIGPALHALRTGNTLLFDEIDASLHPRLSAKLLELFQDPMTNPRGAQLIFTTHDTSLLNHLNRDEVWLTEKDRNGATQLVALAEYGGEKVRRSLNLEKAYLQGRFGAVPELDQQLLRHALGVTGGE